MGSITWGQDVAEAYGATSTEMLIHRSSIPRLTFSPTWPTVSRPRTRHRDRQGCRSLNERGIEVHGIEVSPHMTDQLRNKAGAEAVPVTTGGMTSTRMPGEFKLVYLAWNERS